VSDDIPLSSRLAQVSNIRAIFSVKDAMRELLEKYSHGYEGYLEKLRSEGRPGEA
jgi:hypothetical protein